MPVVSRATLKSYFETGDKPTEDQFIDVFDSLVHQTELPGGGGGGGVPVILGFSTANADAVVRYWGDTAPTFTEDAAGEYTLTEKADTVIGSIKLIGNNSSVNGSGGITIHIVSDDANDITADTSIVDRDSGAEVKNYAAPGISIAQDDSTPGTNEYTITSMNAFGVTGFKLTLKFS